jgi:hypothetical protein
MSARMTNDFYFLVILLKIPGIFNYFLKNPRIFFKLNFLEIIIELTDS